jgi:hypothetical protein
MKNIRGSLILLATVLVAAAAFAASAGASTSMSKNPPCTTKALSAGLKRGPAAQKNARILPSWGCASGWAYSEIAVGKGKNGFDAVAVFKAKNGVWATVNRATPCRKHLVPKKIYRGACTTS